MFYQLAINFCILFTFSVLSYWPFQDRVRFRIPFPRLHPILIGMMAGVTGLFLLGASVTISDGVIVDARLPVIILSGVFGGPASPLISALIIGIDRIMLGGFSGEALIAGSNTLLIGAVAALIFMWRGASFRTARFVFHYAAVQTGLVIIYLLPAGSNMVMNVSIFALYSYISFFTITFILAELSGHFKKLSGIERLSRTDYLTGLHNSRTFGELSEALLTGDRPVSLILLDIDRFKSVNDTYGHPAGDEVLRELAFRLKNFRLPEGAILSRNGGEEFSALLPGTDKQEAAAAAESIRRAVGDNPFILDSGLSLTVTVSLGVSAHPEDAAGTKELYELADEALYRAKNSGRNRVAVHGTTQPVS
ncbi:putative diguanylate cyclase YcdT [Bhargavaea cecembensis DSE10]|uniref:Putative diguanylate cyclase YcdT n=1 Tax=Bhargavaea cecembensis DSE10 TaxID=1235279 RepID=M7NKX1_9BACL|nr:diguanylate cyclase [Bhargavaea cecembensis]EMR07852.1 putative diguanylate cyclase YcdT [Bhargavaea cecembensis DSE10]